MSDPCECPQDGYCQRYKKVVAGRIREICRGENVDPGTAAKYRLLWSQEAGNQPTPQTLANGTRCPHLGQPVMEGEENKKRKCGSCGGGVMRQVFSCQHPARHPDEVTVEDCHSCLYKPRRAEGARKIILKNHLSPGDVLVMSSAIYSLHQKHPGKFVTAVDTTCQPIFEHNPDVAKLDELRAEKAEEVVTHYPAVNQSNQRGITFLAAYCEFFEEALGVRVPLLTNRPHIYLSKQERSWMSAVQEITGKPTKYHVICAGRKDDYVTKFWGTDNYQAVVNKLRGKVLFVQVGANEHYHPPLKNVINLVGKTDFRQLVRLVWHSEGVLCGVTFLQHLAASLEKRSVIIMGGREPVVWNSYPKSQLMHTIGQLPCCRDGGCWKSRIVDTGDGDEKNKSLCESPVIGEEVIGKCMAMITPDSICEKILQCS